MMEIEMHRKHCLKQQTELRRILNSPDNHEQAMRAFLEQHARLHSAKMAGQKGWSYEDALLDDMDEGDIREVSKRDEHSIAWCIWHIARIEDVAMNILVAGEEQIFLQDNWKGRMKLTTRVDTGNAMNDNELRELSNTIDIGELRIYRIAVGRRTREIVQKLIAEDLKKRVDPLRLERVMSNEGLVEAARGIKEYWGRRDYTGLLLMPASRHLLVHLNEVYKIKKQVHKQ